MGVREVNIERPEDIEIDEISQPRYTGRHYSIDWAICNGSVLWGIESIGTPTQLAQFAMWCTPTTNTSPRPSKWLQLHIARALPNFTGIVNVETIGPNVVEVHFRPSVEFFRLYGREAVTALMQVARGERCPVPEVAGGVVVVTPKGAKRVRPNLWGEDSWRSGLHYLPSELDQ